ncbi:MAG TPA: zinc ribbon domain-containing protein [Candidatus Limnocylindrales bacterium]|nr:zinc ribbon domain-containing protein [Candidatus Limnocylindrales bacterium]
MADEIAASAPACPWCSTPLPAADAETCPSCGAQLIPDTDAQVPGVTAIDAEAIVRAARNPAPQRRSRLLAWISGEYETEAEAPPPGSVAPPDNAVRREMLRLELEAEVRNLQAEAGLALSEAEVEARDEATASAAEASDTGAAGADESDGTADAPAHADAPAPADAAEPTDQASRA